MDEPAAVAGCSFERAIVSRTCGCRHANRRNANARLTIHCQSREGQKLCAEMMNQIRKTASFALGSTQAPSALRHTEALKIQCGGLVGLQNALDKVEPNQRVRDIYSLVKRAMKRYSSLAELPEQEIVRSIASFDK